MVIIVTIGLFSKGLSVQGQESGGYFLELNHFIGSSSGRVIEVVIFELKLYVIHYS